MTDLIDSLRRLQEDSQLYRDLLHESEEPLRLAVELTDTGDTATLTLEQERGVASIEEGDSSASVKVTMDSTTFQSILDGRADAFALAGRSRMDEVRPINFEFLEKERHAKAMEAIKSLATFFFLPGRMKSKQLAVERAGEAHGAKPIPIVYWHGLRLAWYRIPSGLTLNEAGERDPWPQAFIVLRGAGSVIIESEAEEITPNTVYYIPRNVVHQIEAKDDVDLIWIAWDAE
ncbi:cupin domain-containing protein [Candidatus Thorarchaeota archaeon]|nr:MAG: cupin domain-containing protein [Candidatus Thorarchaeota archaeon]